MSRSSSRRDERPAPAAQLGRGVKGHHAQLASKPCLQCGQPMSWRKAWAKNWDEVRYCSTRCSQDAARARRAANGGGHD